jgi:2-polyprenyl-6-hydroxyphenyl methylase / 3-demethylubiquinone-9 3-methyltransferase
MLRNEANVTRSEIEKFSTMAARWWDVSGPMRPLHDLNPVRLQYVTTQVGALKGKRILDVGCGGGILSESMAAVGADVTGIDLAADVLQSAQLHGLESGVHVRYREISVEELSAQEAASFDAITCMEMLEHVPDPQSILMACSKLLKPGGSLIVSTIHRNAAAFALAIVGAEYIARLLPRGTHSYDGFIKPSELAKGLREAKLELIDLQGLHYNPLTRKAKLGPRPLVNFVMTARKS